MLRKLTTALLGAILAAASLAATACIETTQAQTPAASASCAPEPPPISTMDAIFADTASTPAYTIGKTDVISVLVEPEVNFLESQKCSKDYTVQSDGRINFCGLTPPPTADGRTAGQLQIELRKALLDSKMYTDVSVTVDVKTYRSQSVYITGPVKTPGELQLQGKDMTIMRAVNSAGGWQADAGSDVWLLRPPAGTNNAVTLDEPRVQQNKFYRKHLTDNLIDPPIQAGDTIYVSTAEPVWINGLVRSFGQKVWEPCMTVGDLINIAGGLTEQGSLGRSHISRRNAKGTFDKIGGLKAETPVLPRDTIVIGKKLF
jgi:polysaccharide export outer membrane protein